MNLPACTLSWSTRAVSECVCGLCLCFTGLWCCQLRPDTAGQRTKTEHDHGVFQCIVCYPLSPDLRRKTRAMLLAGCTRASHEKLIIDADATIIDHKLSWGKYRCSYIFQCLEKWEWRRFYLICFDLCHCSLVWESECFSSNQCASVIVLRNAKSNLDSAFHRHCLFLFSLWRQQE